MENHLSPLKPPFSSKEGQSLFEFYDKLFVRCVPIKDAGVHLGLFTFWRRNGLIDFIEDSKWAKLSYLEVIWVKMLMKMRDFGIPLESLRKVHKHFFARAYMDNAAKFQFEHAAKELEKKISAGDADPDDEARLVNIRSILNDPGSMYIYRTKITYFSNLMMECLESGEETGIFVFDDGSVCEFSKGLYNFWDYEQGRYIPLEKRYENMPPYLYLPLAYFIIEFLSDDRFYRFLPDMGALNQDELEVISEMRNKNVREIRIKRNDGETVRIESDTGGSFDEEKSKDIRKMIGLKQYERISFETRNEKTVSFTKTKKILK